MSREVCATEHSGIETGRYRCLLIIGLFSFNTVSHLWIGEGLRDCVRVRLFKPSAYVLDNMYHVLHLFGLLRFPIQLVSNKEKRGI